MLIIMVGIACAVGGFVAGVLFGRRNAKKVEAAIAQGEKIEQRVIGIANHLESIAQGKK